MTDDQILSIIKELLPREVLTDYRWFWGEMRKRMGLAPGELSLPQQVYDVVRREQAAGRLDWDSGQRKIWRKSEIH